MPQTLKLGKESARVLGIPSIEFPDDATLIEMTDFVNQQLQRTQAPPPPPPPSQPAQVPQEQEGGGAIDFLSALATGAAGLSAGAAGGVEFTAGLAEDVLGVGGELEAKAGAVRQRFLARAEELRPPTGPQFEQVLAQEGLGPAVRELLQPRNVALQLTEQIPNMATMLGGFGVIKAGAKIAGAGPKIASLIAAGGGGTLGVLPESAAAVAEVERQVGSRKQRQQVFAATTAVTGFLNSLGLGVILRQLPDGLFGKVVAAMLRGGAEAGTEVLEEPANAIILKSVGLEGDPLRSLIAGIEVVPAAFIMGGGVSLLSTAFTPETAAELARRERGKDLDPELVQQEERFEFTDEERRAFRRTFSLPEEEGEAGSQIVEELVTTLSKDYEGLTPREYLQALLVGQFPGDEGAVIGEVEALRQALGQTDTAAFAQTLGVPQTQLQQESEAVEITRNEEGRVLAPNGEPSQLNEFLARVTRTPSFRNFYKDSVVLDQNREPLPRFHTTRAQQPITEGGFLPGTHFGTAQAAEDRFQQVTQGSEQARDILGFSTLPTFLSISNPLRIEDAGDFGSPSNIAAALRRADVPRTLSNRVTAIAQLMQVDLNEVPSPFNARFPAIMEQAQKDIQAEIEKAGFDGFVYENESEDVGSDSLVIFQTAQAKSTFNRGGFDPVAASTLLQGTEAIKGAVLGIGVEGGVAPMKDAVRYLIRGFQAADISTAMHEWAHFAALTAQGEAKRVIEEGHKRGPIEGWKTKDHEDFAKAFEMYLFKGETKNKDLEGAMHVVKQGLIRIYRTISRIAGSLLLTTERRAAFDFLLGHEFNTNTELGLEQLTAVEQEVNAALLQGGDKPLDPKEVKRINSINLDVWRDDPASLEFVAEFAQSLEPKPKVPWAVTEARAMEELRKSPIQLLRRVETMARDKQQASAYEVLALQRLWYRFNSILISSSAGVFGGKKVTEAQQRAYDVMRRRTGEALQAHANLAGVNLNAFKIFAATKQLTDSILTMAEEGALTDRQLRRINETDFSSLAKIRELYSEFKSGPIRRALVGMWYASALTNPRTLTRNLIGNMGWFVYVIAEQPVIAAYDGIMARIEGRPREVYASESLQLMGAVMRGVLFQNKEANRGVANAILGIQNKEGASTKWDEGLMGKHTIRWADELLVKILGKTDPSELGVGAKTLAGLMNAGLRGLMAGDFWFKAVAREAFLGTAPGAGGLLPGVRGIVNVRIQQRERFLIQTQNLDPAAARGEAEQQVYDQFILDDIRQNASAKAWSSFKAARHAQRKGGVPLTEAQQRALFEQQGGRTGEVFNKTFQRIIEGNAPIIQEFKEGKRQSIKEEAERTGEALTDNQIEARSEPSRKELEELLPQAVGQAAREASAQRLEEFMTFQTPPFSGSWTARVQEWKAAHPFMGVALFPFIVTIANLTKRGGELIPVLGVPIAKISRLTPAEVMAKQTTGLLLGITIWQMFEEGILTGPPPEDEDERQAWKRIGRLPWSVRIGNKWIDYRVFEPFNLPISIVASIRETYNRVIEDRERERRINPSLAELSGVEAFAENIDASVEALAKVTNALRQTFVDSTYMQNVAGYLGTATNAERGFERLAASLVPYNSMTRSVRDSMQQAAGTGPFTPEDPGVVQQVLRGTPNVSSILEMFGAEFPESWTQAFQSLEGEPQLNVFGEPVLRPNDVFKEWLPAGIRQLSPLVVREETVDAVEQSFITSGWYPNLPGRQLKLLGSDAELTRLEDDVYRRYLQSVGPLLKQQFGRMVQSPHFQRLEKDQQALLLDRRFQAVIRPFQRRAKLEQLQRRIESSRASR